MDHIDKAILDLLQENAAMSRSEIGERVNLSTTPCWRRIQKLKESGIIKREVAILDRDRVNLKLTAFVTISTSAHNPDWLDEFAQVVQTIPEIVECYRMAGDIDYLLRIVVPDITVYDQIYKRLITSVKLTDVSASFAMEELKYSTSLPLEYA